jgi:hypothetical protein
MPNYNVRPISRPTPPTLPRTAAVVSTCRTSALTIALAVALTGCNRAGDNPGGPPSVADLGGPATGGGLEIAQYYPLAIGNTWTYSFEFSGWKESKTVRIDAVDNGTFIDSAGARWLLDEKGLRDQGKRYVLKAPLATGTQWKAVVSAVSVEQYEVTDTRAIVETPAGRFTGCVVVHAKNQLKPGVVQHMWSSYAPGVGLVEVRVEMQSGDAKPVPQSRIRLTAYSLAGGGAGARP